MRVNYRTSPWQLQQTDHSADRGVLSSNSLGGGAGALKEENILKLFEQLTGRKATDAEIAELRAQAALPTLQ